MTPGTYCVPRNRQEWEAILRLADSLGLLWKPFEELVLGERFFDLYDAIAFVDNMKFIKPVSMSECSGEPFYAPDFLNNMYSQRDVREGKAKREAASKNYSSGFMDTSAKRKKFNAPRLTVQDPDPNTGTLDKAEKAGLEIYLNDLNSIMSADINKRLKNLEGAFDLHLQEYRNSKRTISVSDPEDGGATMTFSHRYIITDCSGATIAIDPKASPTNIPFEIALAYLKAGRNVARSTSSSTFVRFSGAWCIGAGLRQMCFGMGGGISEIGIYKPVQDDLAATDWMVLPE